MDNWNIKDYAAHVHQLVSTPQALARFRDQLHRFVDEADKPMIAAYEASRADPKLQDRTSPPGEDWVWCNISPPDGEECIGFWRHRSAPRTIGDVLLDYLDPPVLPDCEPEDASEQISSLTSSGSGPPPKHGEQELTLHYVLLAAAHDHGGKWFKIDNTPLRAFGVGATGLVSAKEMNAPHGLRLLAVAVSSVERDLDPPGATGEWVTPAEAARLCGVNRGTLTRHAGPGKVIADNGVQGRGRKLWRPDVEAFVSERRKRKEASAGQRSRGAASETDEEVERKFRDVGL